MVLGPGKFRGGRGNGCQKPPAPMKIWKGFHFGFPNGHTLSQKSVSFRSDREIHAPPPQNRRSTSRVQNWGRCVFCLFLSFRQFAHHPPKTPLDEEGLLWGWCVVGGPLFDLWGTPTNCRSSITCEELAQGTLRQAAYPVTSL